MIDYREDVTTIISDWDVLATQKRATESYNSRGIATLTWVSVTTAYVDVQPVNREGTSYLGEEGDVMIFSHVIYGCYTVSGSLLSVTKGDRFYVGSDFYDVKDIKTYTNGHLELYCIQVEGKI